MKAVDTNLLVRFFVDDPDDPQAARQRPAAVAILSERVWVSVTVVLEFEWVLRGFYKVPPKEIARVLRALAGIEHITLEDRDAVLAATDALADGLDFADALHVLRSGRSTSFVTFDQRLARRAAKLKLAPPVQVLS
jgi:predicted nucleic-acid-binding protein